jgi:amino acid adenylation domain-containing protein
MPEPAAARAALSSDRQTLLAQRLRRAQTAAGAIRPREPGRRPPLSSSQEGLWFVEQMTPGTAAYTVAVGCSLRGELNRSALEGALAAVTTRHEALRMRFPAGPDGAPVVIIAAPTAPELRLIDMAAAGPAADERGVLQQAAADFTAEPLDLASGPLFRHALIRADAGHHVLVLALHHIIADGWAVELLTREILDAYDALSTGRPLALPALPVQFGDYAVWQRERLASSQLAASISYWRDQLAELPSLDVSAGVRPAEQSFLGADYSFELGRELTQAISDLSRRSGATVYMTLMAALQALLARQAGQYDFAIGSPLAARPYRELEALIGNFVNMVTIRADLGGDPTFREILARCRETVLDAMSHQDLPFDFIVRDLQAERDPGRSPLFQVTLEFDNLRQAAVGGDLFQARPGGLAVSPFAIHRPVTHFDLSLHAAEGASGLSCSFLYRCDLFQHREIEQLASRLTALLRSAAENPDRRLSQLSFTMPAERELVLGRWVTAPEPGGLPPAPLHHVIETQAGQNPDALAVTVDGNSLTHGQLDKRANQMARRLRRAGAGPDTVTAVCLRPSLDLVVAILAVLKAGAAYVPLDPDQPQGRLEYALADAGATVLITDAGAWTGSTHRVCVIDPALEHDALLAESDGPLGPTSGLSNLAYVIYTSGTTGKPKGVAVEHAAVVRYLSAIRDVFGIEPDGSYALLQSLAFDFSILMFYLPLLTGGCLHLLPRNITGRDLARSMALNEIDYLKMTPSHLAALATDAELPSLLPRRALILAGEAAPADFARSLAAEGRCAVFNSYGPTETVVAVTSQRLTADTPAGSAAAPIGRPQPGVRTLVLDDHLAPVPPGVVGELYVGGDRLARGYLNHPAATAQRFVADPFGSPGSRLYRTGDRARWSADGDLEFLGRTDHQVKIRGYRVELGEIEAALGALPGVSQAVADVRRTLDTELVVGYLEMADGGAMASADQIRSELSRWLPEYMIPARYVQVDGFPRQAHGKVDRAALPDPEGRTPERGFVAPRDAVEQAIATAWEQVLGVDQVGIHDNFFDLGGQSLVAIRAVARMRKELGADATPVSVMDIFKYPTVAELAAVARPSAQSAGPTLLYELTSPARDRRPDVTYVCAPYGGANASVYQELATAMPAGSALFAIQAPGRDSGLADEHLPVQELAAACAAEVLRTVEGPLVMYGHCGPGGALAVALALELEAAGRPVDALYLGGVFPFARPTGRVLGPLTRFIDMERLVGDRNHANWLRGMGSEISALDADQARFMIRAMRQDGRLAEAYFTDVLSREVSKLSSPVITIVGERDPMADFYQERYLEWGFLSDTLAVAVLREAGHFFVRHRATELAEVITRTHRALAAGTATALSRGQLGGTATWWLHDSTAMVPAAGAAASRVEPAAADVITAGEATSGRAPAPPAPAPSMSRFLAVMLAQLVSITGSTLTEFALPLWIYLQTGSLARFGLVAILGLIPGMAVAPLAGALVDRYDRRAVMVAGDLGAAVSEAVLLALALTSALQVWQVYLLITVLSVALTFQRLAYLSAIPQLVPKRYLGHANGMAQTASGVAQFIAPLIGVGLLAAVGLRGVLSLDVASYVVAISVVLAIRFPATMAGHRRESVVSEIVQGIRFTLGRPGFRAMTLFVTALNLCISPMFVLTSPLVLSFTSLPSVAAVAAAAGIGAVAGGLAMSVWGGPSVRRMRGARMLLIALAAFGALTGLRPNLLSVSAGMFGVSFCLTMTNGIFLTIIQTKVPRRLQGRVIALITTMAAVSLPFGFGVVAPFGPRLLDRLASSGGGLSTLARAVSGTGHDPGVGLTYVLCALALAVVVVVAGRVRPLARFDADVPDATPDDLLGIEVMRATGQWASQQARGPEAAPADT